jgi:hypothetical protein
MTRLIANVRPNDPVDSGELIYRFMTVPACHSVRMLMASQSDSSHRISGNFNVVNDWSRPKRKFNRIYVSDPVRQCSLFLILFSSHLKDVMDTKYGVDSFIWMFGSKYPLSTGVFLNETDEETCGLGYRFNGHRFTAG